MSLSQPHPSFSNLMSTPPPPLLELIQWWPLLSLSNKMLSLEFFLLHVPIQAFTVIQTLIINPLLVLPCHQALKTPAGKLLCHSVANNPPPPPPPTYSLPCPCLPPPLFTPLPCHAVAVTPSPHPLFHAPACPLLPCHAVAVPLPLLSLSPVLWCVHIAAAAKFDVWLLVIADADRARKHGLDEYVQADPCRFDHADLFKTLQTLTLDYRLCDAYTCLVSLGMSGWPVG